MERESTATFDFGPVEFYLVDILGEQPAEDVITALDELIAAGTVRLRDFLVVIAAADGNSVTEIEAAELVAPGLIGADDVDELAASLPPGHSAAIVALEMAWARSLASKLAASGGEVLRVDRIPAPVVNALFDEFDNAE